MHNIVYTPNAPAPIGPYSQAVLAGNTIYVSGQIAINPETGALETDNIAAETRRVLQNLTAVLNAADFQLHDVVKCSIFIADMGQFATINEVYAEFFSDWKPARETVEVACLPKNVNVEISAIAVRHNSL
jgi:2-iminobutanoate/2-iminopropanoate deaminase